MTRLLACLTAWAIGTTAVGQQNLVRNPSFESGGGGAADHWQAAGDSRLVTQTLGVDKGRDGKRCARLACTQFKAGNPAAHVMLCQMGVPVQRGKSYRLVLWARGENILCDMVSIALSDTASWNNCGLQDSFAPTPEWQRYEFVFRATKDCGAKSRFQIWFNSTGSLWMDDVQFEEAGRDLYRPGTVIAADGRASLVPNASFECGTCGWGPAEWDRVTHWGGPLNDLVGRLDTSEAFHGRCSLCIELAPDRLPVSYFDYYELHRAPIRAPLAANLGFLQVEPGRRYTLSVYMKARDADTPARLAVQQFMGGRFDQAVRVSTEWKRYSLSFQPTARWCYVLAGPDLCRTQQDPDPPSRAAVWLDAVQLQQGDTPAAFSTRDPLEFGVGTDKPGNVFDWNEPLRFHLELANCDPDREHTVRIELRLTDFFDKQVWRNSLEKAVPAGERLVQQVTLDADATRRGFLRLHAKMAAGELACERSIRLAAVPIHRDEDSRFGVNHAYPWPHLLELCRMAGLRWVRDWSLKWQQLEPEKGKFSFTETDYQIDRPLEHGLAVLGLVPFPSSNWSSGAPASVAVTDRYPQNRSRVAYAPRDVSEFETFVERTVAHYKNRIRWWQVFNEPLFTSYSLPRKHGYNGADYARLTRAFAEAARRADPQCRILAGIGYLGEGQIMEDFAQFFEGGGLEAIDAVDIHHYPRLRPPEFAEGLLDELNALMDKHGGRKPIWLTEYGYYADDEPWAVPMPHSGFNRPLPDERVQAAYAVRWAILMFAGGVDKIFYHAGTCDGVNQDSLQGIFFEYAGRPHKIYAAQAVMSHLFTPTCRFVERLELADRVKGYLFRDAERLVGVVWAARGAKPNRVRLTQEKLQLWDIMGRPQPSRDFTPGGTPVYIVSERLSAEAFRAGLQ